MPQLAHTSLCRKEGFEVEGERISENLDFQTGIRVTSQERDDGPDTGRWCVEKRITKFSQGLSGHH